MHKRRLKTDGKISEELLAHRCGILNCIFKGVGTYFGKKMLQVQSLSQWRSCSKYQVMQFLSDPLKLSFCRHQTFGTEGMTRKFAKEAEGIISTSSTTRQSPEPRWPRVGQIFPYPAPKVFSEIVATQPKIHTGVWQKFFQKPGWSKNPFPIPLWRQLVAARGLSKIGAFSVPY